MRFGICMSRTKKIFIIFVFDYEQKIFCNAQGSPKLQKNIFDLFTQYRGDPSMSLCFA